MSMMLVQGSARFISTHLVRLGIFLLQVMLQRVGMFILLSGIQLLILDFLLMEARFLPMQQTWRIMFINLVLVQHGTYQLHLLIMSSIMFGEKVRIAGVLILLLMERSYLFVKMNFQKFISTHYRQHIGSIHRYLLKSEAMLPVVEKV